MFRESPTRENTRPTFVAAAGHCYAMMVGASVISLCSFSLAHGSCSIWPSHPSAFPEGFRTSASGGTINQMDAFHGDGVPCAMGI